MAPKLDNSEKKMDDNKSAISSDGEGGFEIATARNLCIRQSLNKLIKFS